MKVGYARVSTKDQMLDLQVDALKKAGCSKIYTETVSGAKADRPALAKLMDALRAGDVLVISTQSHRVAAHLTSPVQP